MWKARKKRRLLAGEQEFLCHHPSWALVFQEKWDRSVSSAGAENWNNFTGSKRGQSCIRINPDHCGCYIDRATFHFLARAKLKEPLQVALVTSILSLERHTSLPPSSVTLHPQDSAILWPRACDWELGLLIRDKTMGKSNKQANTITSSEVRAYPTPRGKEATESMTGFMFTVVVQCLSTGDAGLGLILICAGCFDLTPLLSGRKACIYIWHSRARDLRLLCYKSQCN